MQCRIEGSVRKKMEEIRLVCEREIQIQQQRMDAAVVSFRKSLESTNNKAHESVNNLAKLGKLKAELREVEDDLVKALAAKTRKEANRMATIDYLSATRSRIEELKRIVEDQKARKNQYAEIMTQQHETLSACEKNCNKNKQDLGEIEKAISWYNKILGFRIECGHGVKFIFTNIDLKNPNVEYSFSIRHENDLYILLDCDPHLSDIKKVMHELNKSNGLYRFVRTMRQKFQEAAAHGNLHQISQHQECSTICVSAPAASVSTESRSESMSRSNELRPEETNRSPKKVKHGKFGKSTILSPGSASSLRRSPRFQFLNRRCNVQSSSNIDPNVVTVELHAIKQTTKIVSPGQGYEVAEASPNTAD